MPLEAFSAINGNKKFVDKDRLRLRSRDEFAHNFETSPEFVFKSGNLKFEKVVTSTQNTQNAIQQLAAQYFNGSLSFAKQLNNVCRNICLSRWLTQMESL